MIPFVDLKVQYLSIKAELDEAVISALERAHYVLGPSVTSFEKHFSEYCGTSHAVTVNSGSSALHLALLALGVGPGDEVITVAMTFVATVSAIIACGARPVLVDIDPNTWNMDPAKVALAITPKTKAIMPVHLHGLMADMDPILSLAQKHGIAIIEDAAQAHGAEYKGHRAGTMGDIGCFSFYPAKNLGACGEGGAVVTNNEGYAEKIKMLRDWGQARKYQHVLQGYNYRMDDIQAAVLDVKLKYIESWTEKRETRAALYDQYLKKLDIFHPVRLQEYRHVFHVYAIIIKNRDLIQKRLADLGIATGIHYPVPVHLQIAYAGLGYKLGDFPITEQVAEETLSLPMYPELTDENVKFICETLAMVLAENKLSILEGNHSLA